MVTDRRMLSRDYPAVLDVKNPIQPWRMERIRAALTGLDYIECFDTVSSPPSHSFHFRREADVQTFQNRLAQ